MKRASHALFAFVLSVLMVASPFAFGGDLPLKPLPSDTWEQWTMGTLEAIHNKTPLPVLKNESRITNSYKKWVIAALRNIHTHAIAPAPPPPPPPPPITTPSRLLVAEYPRNITASLAWATYNAQPCLTIDKNLLGPAGDGGGFESFYAPIDYRGYAIIDFEFSSTDTDVQKRIAAIAALRLRWPNAKIGVYSPPVIYWHPVESRPMRLADIEHPALKLIENQWRPIADASDFVVVSCYDLYGDPENHAQSFDSEAARSGIRWAKRFGKPVMATVWRRFHDSNAALGLQLIDQVEYRTHIQAVNQEADLVAVWGYDEGWVRTNHAAFMAKFNAEKPSTVSAALWLRYLAEEAVAQTAIAMGMSVPMPPMPGALPAPAPAPPAPVPPAPAPAPPSPPA